MKEDRIRSPLGNALREEPFEQIDHFQDWAKSCITHYITHGNLYQAFQVAHAMMLFESLLSTTISSSESWLDKTSISALYVLSKITDEKDPAAITILNEELLSILLCIREYYVINKCLDPYSSIMTLGEVWLEPVHPPKHYLNTFRTITETLT